MPHITVVPASTKAGRETIRVLLNSEKKPLVRGIYRDASRAPAEFVKNPSFEAVQGDVGSGSGLDFDRSDAVFYIPPPIYDGTNTGEFATRAAKNIESALAASSSVKRLLLFSAIGAQNDHGIASHSFKFALLSLIRMNQGILRLNHIAENILKNAVSEVVIIRPSYFQEDFASALEEARADPPVIHSIFTPIDHKIPMVSLKDISQVCADSLLTKTTKSSPHYFKLFGPRSYSPLDLKKAVEEVTGKEVELKLVEKDQLAGFFAKQLPEPYVQEFVDMTTAGLPGGVIDRDFVYDDDTVQGRVELVDALRELYTK